MDTREHPQSIRLKDYRVPDYQIETVDLEFDLQPDATRVKSRLAIRANYDDALGQKPLTLDGEDLKLVGIGIDGRPLKKDEYSLSDSGLVISAPPANFTLEIETLL